MIGMGWRRARWRRARWRLTYCDENAICFTNTWLKKINDMKLRLVFDFGAIRPRPDLLSVDGNNVGGCEERTEDFRRVTVLTCHCMR